MIRASMEEIEAVFTEWERRYRAKPEEFMSEVRRLLEHTPESFGHIKAEYFASLLYELGLRPPRKPK